MIVKPSFLRYKKIPKRRNYKKTSEGAIILPQDGYYARKAHIPISGAAYGTLCTYIQHGLRLFPLYAHTKFPLKGSNGHNDATNSRHFPVRWWWNFDNENDRFGYNFGMLTGKRAGVTVIDSDGQDGEGSIDELEEMVGPLPKTVTVITPRGGKHRYFKYTSILSCRNDIMPKVDIKNGGFVVTASSNFVFTNEKARYNKFTGEYIKSDEFAKYIFAESHPTHHSIEYKFAPGCSLNDLPMAKLPEIHAKAILFNNECRHLWKNLLLLPIEERIRHIEEWYEDSKNKKPLPEGRVVGIMSNRE